MSQHAKIIENLQRAIGVIEMVPEKRLDLMTFCSQRSCGTIFCTAGWLTTDDFFREQGWRIRPYGHGFIVYDSTQLDMDMRDAMSFGWMDRFFGEQAFGRLFAMYGEGTLDKDAFTVGEPAPSDKALALYRLRHQLAEYERLVQHEAFLTTINEEKTDA